MNIEESRRKTIGFEEYGGWTVDFKEVGMKIIETTTIRENSRKSIDFEETGMKSVRQGYAEGQ